MKKTILGLGTAVLVLVATPAWAHVSVESSNAETGGYPKVTFRVQNEKDVPTVQVQVVLPDAPIESVSVKPTPGWTHEVQLRGAAGSGGHEGGTHTAGAGPEVVESITWSADGAGILAGEFEEFDISLGPLPDVESLTFKALQTYEGGEVVSWIEEQEGSVEPEFPAPVLPLGSGEEGEEGAEDAHGHAEESGVSALGVAVVALLVALVALGLTLFRGRKS